MCVLNSVCMYVCIYVGFGYNYVLPSLGALREECAEHIQRGCGSHGKGTVCMYVCMYVSSYIHTYLYIHTNIHTFFLKYIDTLRKFINTITLNKLSFVFLHIYIHLCILHIRWVLLWVLFLSPSSLPPRATRSC